MPDDPDIESIQIWRSETTTWIEGLGIAEVKGTSYNDLIGAVDTTRYYWIRTRSRSGKYSDWSTVVSATTVGISPTDISDFALTASKTFTKIPVLENDAWTDNSPAAGKIAWNQHNIAYNGAWYQVAAGNSNTTSHYVYWFVGHTGGSGTVANPYITSYTVAVSAPTLDDTKFIIATNVAGVHSLAWNSMANQVIGSAYILDAAITNAKIGLLAVDTAQIAELAVTTAKINTLAVTNAKIGACAVDKLTAGNITSKDIELAVAAGAGDVAIRAGKTDFTNTETGFILGIDDSDSDKPKFYIGNTTKYLNWDGAALTIRGTLNAEDLTAGIITGVKVRTDTGAAGHYRRIELDVSDNTLRMYNAANVNMVTINDDADGYMYIGDGEDYSAHGDAFSQYWSDTNNKIVLSGNYYNGIAWLTNTFAIDVNGVAGFSKVAAPEYWAYNNKVVGAQGAAVANATDAASVIARLNDLLARLRTHGLIDT